MRKPTTGGLATGHRLPRAVLGLAIGGGLLAGCGEGADPRPDVSAPRTYAGEATTADGRYRITLALGDEAGAGSECGPPAPPGQAVLPVVLTVANADAGRPAPFPPLRIELVRPDRRQEVMVVGPSVSCTSTPRLPVLTPGESIVFRGSTPPIETGAAPGTAGSVEVAISENRFSLTAPVP